MFKKLFFASFVLMGCAVGAKAQNIQLHYDFGSALYNELDARPKLTSTVENFKADKWGSTYFFIDMDYKDGKVESAYWEIARELKFWQGPLSYHIEYNGGVGLDDAYLTGATYTYNSGDFSKGFSLSALYKYIRHAGKVHNFQFTGTWYINFSKDLFKFTGFADLWREKTAYGNMIFLSEPQIWLNLNKIKGVDPAFNLSIGSEVELSNNFAGRDGFYAIPTLAVKWTFN